MKRLIILLIAGLLVLSSCSSKKQDEDLIKQSEEEGKTEVSVIPNYSLSDEQYKIMLPYRPSAARGAITNQVTNRVDIDELEEGLRRLSTDVYSPDDYLFEEGQYLSTDYIFSLIDSLNPKVKDSSKKKDHQKNPRIFSHILEQNYLVKTKNNSVKLEGLSIGISLKSVYRYQTETGGPYFYEKIPQDEMITEGKKIAEKVLKEIRGIEELSEVPVMFALFREEEQSSPIPGQFVSKGITKKGANKIDKWEAVNEENILFPSDKAKEKYLDDHEKVNTFSKRVAEYFPNYVGVVGRGFYQEKELKRLSLEIPIEFYGKGEVLGFTQYTYGLVQEIFSKHYDIEVKIESSEGVESLIYRKAGDDEAQVHIFH